MANELTLGLPAGAAAPAEVHALEELPRRRGPHAV